MQKSKVAKRGQLHTMSDVFVAVVYSRDMFSVRKYRLPPVSPRDAMRSSSLALLHISFFGEMKISMMYATEKRRAKMAAGVNPLASSIFVDTNVVPHIMTMTMASIWKKSDCFGISLFIQSRKA